MEPEILTTRQWQERVAASRKRLMAREGRIWPDGSKRTCPICKKRTLVGRSDLVREVDSDGVVLVFSNLHGGHCTNCGTETLEPYEQVALEERAGTAFRTTIEGSVTTLGGNKLGTYWPKDIAEALGLHAKDRLRITPLAPDTAVVRVVHDHE